jgi:fluoride exporter
MSRRRLGWLGLILAGAMVGTSLRAALESEWPAVPGAWPWTTFWINLAGSFFLGALLEFLAASPLTPAWQRGLRLGLGTGLLGGFTTYSSFATEAASLGTSGAILISFGYALASVAAGVLLAASGMLAARRLTGGQR